MTTSIQKTLEVLNDSKITGHISGRHLIQVHQREDNNDENEYEYLDEWLQRKLSQALTEQHEADVQSFREMLIAKKEKEKFDTCLEILFVIAWGIFFASIVNL